jgi:hypothetical protein
VSSVIRFHPSAPKEERKAEKGREKTKEGDRMGEGEWDREGKEEDEGKERNIRKSCDTMTTPPSNSLIARASASIDSISKWLVGSSD